MLDLNTEVRARKLQPSEVNRITRRVLYSDVVPSTAATALLKSMLASPAGRDETAWRIANRLKADGIELDLARPLITLLAEQEASRGLPDRAFEYMSEAFPDIDDAALRGQLFGLIRESNWALTNHDEFLPSVGRLLESRFPNEERWQALDQLTQAVADGVLPSRARSYVSQYAASDPDPRMRVAAWSIDQTQARANGERGINLALLRELSDPQDENSLYFADPDTRERGIAIILDAARPHLPRELVDGLISVAVETGSAIALRELAELRRKDGLLEMQLEPLRTASPVDPDAQALLSAIVAPPLSDVSVIGPVEGMQYARSREVRSEAFRLLLEKYTEESVPDEIAELAYEQMLSNRDVPGAAGTLFALADQPFSSQERRLLKLVDRSPRPHGAIVAGLSALNGDAGREFLVREYAGRPDITETFRASLVGYLYREIRDGGELQPETVAVLQALGESAENYGTVDAVIRVFDSVGEPVSWSIRFQSMDFQWLVLGYILIGSWVMGLIGGVAWLLHIALPYEKRQSPAAARVLGVIGWLLVAVAFAGANVAALLLSLGHTSTPPPNQAAPYYLIVLGLACAIAAIGTGVWIRRFVDGRELLAD